MDGSVRGVTNSINLATWRAVGTRCGGEAVGATINRHALAFPAGPEWDTPIVSRFPREGRAMKIRPFHPEDTDAVVALWRRCEMARPWNDPHKDIRRKLAVEPELFLVGELDGAVVASAMIGYDGHRGWVYYLGVDPSVSGAGWAGR